MWELLARWRQGVKPGMQMSVTAMRPVSAMLRVTQIARGKTSMLGLAAEKAWALESAAAE